MATKIPVAGLLMPKATAVWLVENTPLTFEQIASFTGMHHIEIQAMADEEVGRGIVGRNPVEHKEVSQQELDKAIDSALNGDGTYCMKMAKTDLPSVKVRAKGPRYTPVTKRQDKPDAIAYILKHNPEISDAQICKLIGTTKPTIQSIRDREHPNMPNIKARHPVDCGLCTYGDLDAASRKGLKAQGKTPEEITAHKEKAYQQNADLHEERNESKPASGFDFSNFLKTSSN